MYQAADMANGSFFGHSKRISLCLPDSNRHGSHCECIQRTHATVIHQDVNRLFSPCNSYLYADSTILSATAAGDRQVRVFDVGESIGHSPSGNEMKYSTAQACIRILRCHSRRTKRVITEDSPDFFLTVAEVCIHACPIHSVLSQFEH